MKFNQYIKNLFTGYRPYRFNRIRLRAKPQELIWYPNGDPRKIKSPHSKIVSFLLDIIFKKK